MVKRKALVTGGAGFIGSHLCNSLIENNYEVIAFDDLSNGSGRKNLKKDIKIIKGNILNSNNVKRFCKKVDVVFNLAVKPLPMSFNKPEEVVKTNDYGTYLVAKICAEYKTKLIHISSSEVYGTAKKIPMNEEHPLNPSTIYAASKAASEMYVKGFERFGDLKYVIIRPFNSYGGFMREDMYAAVIPIFFKNILNNKPIKIFGTGNQTRDFTFVSDTCNGIILADQTKNAIGEIFNIGNGKEISIKKIAKVIYNSLQESSDKKISLSIKFHKERKGDVYRHLADIKKARKTLGYKPKILIEEGIKKYIKFN